MHFTKKAQELCEFLSLCSQLSQVAELAKDASANPENKASVAAMIIVAERCREVAERAGRISGQLHS